ncbi:MAG TPA: hypothetical protein P5543_01760 [Planctomycetota bacterium]|nr:hypothetical protein [Planctomycetota bacterium]
MWEICVYILFFSLLGGEEICSGETRANLLGGGNMLLRVGYCSGEKYVGLPTALNNL